MSDLTIAGKPIRLREPLVFEAMEILCEIDLPGPATLRRLATSLGVLWDAGCGRPVMQAKPSNVDAYGKEMVETLIARGATFKEIRTAGLLAYSKLREVAGADVTPEEVEDAADFSGAPDGSTPE